MDAATQEQYETREQPKDLEEAKVWIAALRVQVNARREIEEGWSKRLHDQQEATRKEYILRREAEMQLSRERRIVDSLLALYNQ